MELCSRWPHSANSLAHRICVREVAALQSSREFSDDAELTAYIAQDVVPPQIDAKKLTPESREVYDTLLLLAEEFEAWGVSPIGGYIISMTRSPSDVLDVLWLWRTAWGDCHDDENLPALPIIPLFETIDLAQVEGWLKVIAYLP